MLYGNSVDTSPALRDVLYRGGDASLRGARRAAAKCAIHEYVRRRAGQ